MAVTAVAIGSIERFAWHFARRNSDANGFFIRLKLANLDLAFDRFIDRFVHRTRTLTVLGRKTAHIDGDIPNLRNRFTNSPRDLRVLGFHADDIDGHFTSLRHHFTHGPRALLGLGFADHLIHHHV